jgi:hypothetical protein
MYFNKSHFAFSHLRVSDFRGITCCGSQSQQPWLGVLIFVCRVLTFVCKGVDFCVQGRWFLCARVLIFVCRGPDFGVQGYALRVLATFIQRLRPPVPPHTSKTPADFPNIVQIRTVCNHILARRPSLYFQGSQSKPWNIAAVTASFFYSRLMIGPLQLASP